MRLGWVRDPQAVAVLYVTLLGVITFSDCLYSFSRHYLHLAKNDALQTGETGYIPKNGPGIRVTIQDERGKEVAYTFICDEAEAVAKILSGEA